MTDKTSEPSTEDKPELELGDFDSRRDDQLKSDNVDEAYQVAGRVAITFSQEESNTVRRKIDWRVPVLCAAVYFSQFLDKTLLNYASITGLPIKGQEYNQVSAAFYYGYLVFVFPSANLAQRCPWGPTVYLGGSLVAWGVVLACTSINASFPVFFVLRFILGMLESCVTPILIGTIVAFYRTEEQAKRIACFYAMNGVTMIVGPLIGYAVTFYSGAAFGGGPWRLLYIVCGLCAFLLGIVIILFLPSSPMDARFLNDDEKRIALERIRGNSSGTVQKKLKWSQIREAIFDGRIWLALLFIALTSVPNGGLSNFSSIILKNVGYTSRQTLLIGLPEGVIASVFTLTCAYLSDKYRERMLPVLLALIPTITGASILVGFGNDPSHHKGALVFAIYIAQTFGSSLTIVYAWNASNVAGSSKKTAAYAAMMFSFALGNICGTYIFQAKDAPNYVPGKTAVLIILVLAGIDACILRLFVVKANKKKHAHIQQMKLDNGWTDDDIAKERDALAFQDLTDKQNPFFSYTA